MLIRSAFWLGKPQPGFEQAFRSAIDDEMMPGFKDLPGVLNARALWPRKFEDNPPPIHCQVFVEFADEAGLAAMLASPGRAALRTRVGELAANFDGHIAHIDYNVG
jgi:antibiotic biosynthesis monooxygenase (ABM) superfamily enzyme